jgi:DNA polymerase I
MLEAFKKGGDFHSRTAMNMYDYISKAVQENKVLLEWKPRPGEDKPPVPLLKVSSCSYYRGPSRPCIHICRSCFMLLFFFIKFS